MVDLPSGLDDPLLFIDVGRFVIFADLVALAESIPDQDGPGIAEVGNEAGVIMDEDDDSATATVVALLPPFTISLEKSLSQSRGNILPPLQVEEVLMQLVLQELRALRPSMTVIDAEPLCIVLKIDGNLVLIGLAVHAFMSNGRIRLQVRRKTASNSLWNLRNLPRWLLGGLLLPALLTGEVQKRTLQSLSDEVSVDAVLSDAGSGKHFFKIITRSAWLNERLLLLSRLRFHDLHVLCAFDSE